MHTTSQILKLLEAEGVKISRQALNYFKNSKLVKERDYKFDTATTIYTTKGKNRIFKYYLKDKSSESNS